MVNILQKIICEIFPSKEMREYLCRNMKDLESWQIIDMISGAKVSLNRKRELFIQLSHYIESHRTISENSDEDLNYDLEKECLRFVSEIDRAMEDLCIQGKEDGILLVNKKIQVDNTHKTIEVVPFYDYRKLESYMQEQEENGETMNHVWYEIERYRENDNGDLEEFCDYIVISRKIMYYSYYRTYDCLPNPNLNLPIPFKPGDVISADSLPFAEEKQALILETGDNHDCCSIQVMHLSRSRNLETTALKHASHFFDNEGYYKISALYTAGSYQCDGSENDQVLKIVSRYVNGDEDRGRALGNCLPAPCMMFNEKFIKERVNELQEGRR